MKTINSGINITGIALMDGKEASVRMEPSVKEGIYFYPENSNDLPIKACLENVISTLHCTVLGDIQSGKQVRVVEHFLAACAFTGIDSLNVYMSSSELPILDGSAVKWVDAFNNAGIRGSDDTKLVEIYSPIELSAGNTSIVILPADKFQITYCVNFDHPDLSQKWYCWDVSSEHKEIIEARTFGYLRDLEKFQQAGFALGVSVDNTIGLTESGFTTELRSQSEPIKHKILDLIGDLNLLDINPLNIKGHIIAKEAGHKFHVDFAKVMRDYMESQLCQTLKK